MNEEDQTQVGVGPRAMTRVLQLFTTLAKHRKGLTLTGLSQALAVPKSTLLNSLRPLVNEGYLVADGASYKLGPSAFRFAGSIMSAFSMPDLIETYVRALAEQTHESVGFAVSDWKVGRMIYINTVPSPQLVVYAMVAGVGAPLYASAGGRVILAHAPDDLREAYLSRGPFKPLTSRTETDPDRLRQKLIQIREEGFCASFGEMLDDTAAMAAPIFEGHGNVLGALVIGAPLKRMHANANFLLSKLLSISHRASGREGTAGSGQIHLTSAQN